MYVLQGFVGKVSVKTISRKILRNRMKGKTSE